ncbi:hypothetical protein N7539_008799 [Penicillium diatomitis]|uniref:Uncharacterized protein n=1 Tax=Penicillium diatomitis TaxID=2819901 RepID=A0A9W9WQJ7_9EURO|nr:uncharacterized protein N7539_008799 [Penicillium diatomitis]KAJ5471856.1 hypothetical protein N7539_008799 [Penicillium diatomitis]
MEAYVGTRGVALVKAEGLDEENMGLHSSKVVVERNGAYYLDGVLQTIYLSSPNIESEVRSPDWKLEWG